jgi:hypothetical protein
MSSFQPLAQASGAAHRKRDGSLDTGAPGALWGRAEPLGPELLRGGGLRIVATDHGKERRDQRTVRVQEGLALREVGWEGRPQPRTLLTYPAGGSPFSTMTRSRESRCGTWGQ